jgi:hydrogenase maturation protein HypF
MALGYLLGAERIGDGASATVARPVLDPELVEAHLGRFGAREVAIIRTQVERHLNAPPASSAGRLFDAAASLLGLRDVAEYEAQAAIDLELAAGDSRAEPLAWRLAEVDGLLVYDPLPTLADLLAGRAAGRPVGRLAAAFHETVADVTRELVAAAGRDTGLRTVCLSGGVFQNRRLAGAVIRRLRADGFRVLINRRVPVNDGGISYGQAAVAAARLAAAGAGDLGPGSG